MGPQLAEILKLLQLPGSTGDLRNLEKPEAVTEKRGSVIETAIAHFPLPEGKTPESCPNGKKWRW
jgi:hypothetical protein